MWNHKSYYLSASTLLKEYTPTLKRFSSSLERAGVTASSPSTEKRIPWDGVLIPDRFHWRINAQIELLSQVLARPELRP